MPHCHSVSDAPERVIDNPTYGEDEATGQCNSHKETQQYNSTVSDYEPINTESKAEHGHTLSENSILHIEDTHYGQSSSDSTQPE